MTDQFRTNALTVLGAAGYLVFLILVLLDVTGYSVEWKLIVMVLLTSSSLLSIDFGLDIFPVQFSRQTNRSDEDRPKNEDGR